MPIIVLILLFGIYLNVSLSGTAIQNNGSSTTTKDYNFGSSAEAANDSLGLELQISENSSVIPSQDAINISFSLWNALSKPNNFTTSNDWVVQGLEAGPCQNFYSPIGIAVYRGYYDENNVSAANPLPIWAVVECIASYIFNGTTIVGLPLNYSSYSLFPNSNVGYYEAYYTEYNSQNISEGWFPTTLGGYSIVYASSSGAGFNSLGSSQPYIYTVAVGDEWGQLALLHFQVVPSNNLPIVGSFLAAPSTSYGCSENGTPVPCETGEFSQALILNCASQAATQSGCTFQQVFTITVWYPLFGQPGEPEGANCKFDVPGDSVYSPGWGQCIPVNSTAFAISPI